MAPQPSRGEHPANNTLTLSRHNLAGNSPHPLPLNSSDSPVAPLRDAASGPLSRLGNNLARLGRRSARVAPECPADTSTATPAVRIRLPSTLPPRHSAPSLQARADEPAATDHEVERESIDDGVFLRHTTISHPDPVQDRIRQLEVQRTRLLQLLNDWSWSPGSSFQNQTVLGILMNMKMAANPCFENAAVRGAGIQHLRAEISRVDLELATLTATRCFTNSL